MGLSNPAGGGGKAPNLIMCESNTPAVGSPGVYLFDTFYDKLSNEIDSGDVVAALAALGLIYDDGTGIFTSSQEGVWMVQLQAYLREAPVDQVNGFYLSTSMFQTDSRVSWDSTNPFQNPNIWMNVGVFMNDPDDASDFFKVAQSIGGTETDSSVADYVTLTITRLQ